MKENICIVVTVLIILMLVFDFTSIKVYRFYRPGCIYCKLSHADWVVFKSQCMVKRVKCYDINMDEASDSEKELYSNLGGNGVPFIVKVHPDGRRYVFEGERTVTEYHRWINMHN